MTGKWALYARTSTRDKQNPEMQILQLREYAERSGYEYDLYTEQKSTRKTRPMKEKVLRMLRNREYSGVIVYKLDRWGRSTAELSLELNEFNEKGINFISIHDNIDMTSAMGRFFVHLIAALAEMERDLTRERVMDGLEAAKASGKTLGRPKGSKDKKSRNKSGYYLRYAGK